MRGHQIAVYAAGLVSLNWVCPPRASSLSISLSTRKRARAAPRILRTLPTSTLLGRERWISAKRRSASSSRTRSLTPRNGAIGSSNRAGEPTRSEASRLPLDLKCDLQLRTSAHGPAPLAALQAE